MCSKTIPLNNILLTLYFEYWLRSVTCPNIRMYSQEREGARPGHARPGWETLVWRWLMAHMAHPHPDRGQLLSSGQYEPCPDLSQPMTSQGRVILQHISHSACPSALDITLKWSLSIESKCIFSIFGYLGICLDSPAHNLQFKFLSASRRNPLPWPGAWSRFCARALRNGLCDPCRVERKS